MHGRIVPACGRSRPASVLDTRSTAPAGPQFMKPLSIDIALLEERSAYHAVSLPAAQRMPRSIAGPCAARPALSVLCPARPGDGRMTSTTNEQRQRGEAFRGRGRRGRRRRPSIGSHRTPANPTVRSDTGGDCQQGAREEGRGEPTGVRTATGRLQHPATALTPTATAQPHTTSAPHPPASLVKDHVAEAPPPPQPLLRRLADE